MSQIIGFCNPLLDISTHVPKDFLTAHNLKENDAILAQPQHGALVDELERMGCELHYSAGGAGQNAMRACQWLLPNGSVGYMGAVGTDDNAAVLSKAAEGDGLTCHYMTVPDMKTGTCVCLLTPGHRSLVADLQAAVKFDASHVINNMEAMLSTRSYYVSGFLLTDSFSVALQVATLARQHQKVLYLNLSAPFVCQFFLDRLKQVLPACQVLFGNEAEARALAQSIGLPGADTASIMELVPLLAKLEVAQEGEPRIVIITQGPDSTIYYDPKSGQCKSVKVPAMHPKDIIDTNGAGDAFVGGFLAAHLQGGRTVEQCIDIGHCVAQIVITQSGVVFPDHLKPLL